jgi:type VI secretion system secreted protein Hcp
MANACYVSIKGETQGKFKGESSFSKLASDKITVIRFASGVISPRDSASGLPTGKRRHQPIKFTKENGAATPQIFHALVTNETLTTVTFEFSRSSPSSGKEEIHYVVTLKNASVASVVTNFDQTSRGDPFDGHELVDVELTYESITVEDKIAKTTAQDDWEPAD